MNLFKFIPGVTKMKDLYAKLNSNSEAVEDEINNARGAHNSIHDFLSIAHNADGTLRGDAVPEGGWWTPELGVVAYLSPTSFVINGNKAMYYLKRMSLQVEQGSQQFTHVAADATYDEGTDKTTVVIDDAVLVSGSLKVWFGQDAKNAPKADEIKFATQEEVNAGTSTSAAISPDTLSKAKLVKLSLFTAVNDFIVGTGTGTAVKKTLAEVKAILGLTNMPQDTKVASAVKVSKVFKHDYFGGL
jgi:hypothetical protein